MFKKTIVLAAIAISVLLRVPEAQAGDEMTGCLTNGNKVVKIAVGDTPSKPSPFRSLPNPIAAPAIFQVGVNLPR